MKHRTGLRHRWRSGRGSYSKRKKRGMADKYGTWSGGRRHGPETINGRTLYWYPTSYGEIRAD